MDIPEEAERRYPAVPTNADAYDYQMRLDRQIPLRRAFIAGAEWARKQTLEDAGSAIARCGYVVDNDRTAFPSQRAIDQWEALDAVRALAEGVTDVQQ